MNTYGEETWTGR